MALALGGFCMGLLSSLRWDSSKRSHKVSDSVFLSQAFSAYALGVTIGAPVIAILAAKVPRKTLLIGLMLFYGIANASTALANSYESMLVSR